MASEEIERLVQNKKVIVNNGITPLSLLGVAFIIMKIIGYIDWSWIWILAPFWIPICIALVFSLIFKAILALTKRVVCEASKKSVTPTEVIQESTKEDKGKEKKPKRKSKKSKDEETNVRESEEKNG